MADSKRPLWQWSACELAEAIAARKVTAVEAVGQAVTRMRATNDKINAVVDDLGLQLLLLLLQLLWMWVGSGRRLDTACIAGIGRGRRLGKTGDRSPIIFGVRK